MNTSLAVSLPNVPTKTPGGAMNNVSGKGCAPTSSSLINAASIGSRAFTSMISVTVKTAKEKTFAAGAIFGRRDLRIVRINKFTVEVIPEGRMLVLYNNDKPGVIGNIGTTLGQNGVNIARLHLSREQVDGQAMVVLGTDSVVSPELLDKLRKLPNMISVTELEM